MWHIDSKTDSLQNVFSPGQKTRVMSCSKPMTDVILRPPTLSRVMPLNALHSRALHRQAFCRANRDTTKSRGVSTMQTQRIAHDHLGEWMGSNENQTRASGLLGWLPDTRPVQYLKRHKILAVGT